MLMSCQDLVNEAVVSRAAEAAARQIPPLWPLSSSVAVKNLDIRRRPDAPVRSIYPLFIIVDQQ